MPAHSSASDFSTTPAKASPQDYHEAVRWIRKAADQGNPQAQYALGIHYEKGEGVRQDHIQAHMWLDLAARQQPTYGANPAASALRDGIAAAKMTQEQISEAQRLAREWTATRDSPEPPERESSDEQFFGNFLIGQYFANIRFNITQEKFCEFVADIPDDLRDLVSSWCIFYLLWLMRMAFRQKRGDEFEAAMMRSAYGKLMATTQERGVPSMTVPFAQTMRKWFDLFDSAADAALALKPVNEVQFLPIEWKLASILLVRDSNSPYYFDPAKHGRDEFDTAAAEIISRLNGVDISVAKALAKAKNAALDFILLAPDMKRPSVG
jgi:Sel1 repeat